ncbi:hypothetical protein [Urbifossiella limnaea]|uniref:Uncharacterized protein n=1 Tax=Urbifossiella limnaea TaxID=2528023 RepID=A0A517XLW7_9BACT|nr:hypothetical protein [Urbifossiella limnaea]QDU18466.1 hypothetical protein ETAA1_03540 [Urbifossiella limnaea]
MDDLVSSGLKLPAAELTELRQLALLRSIRSGERVTVPDLVRPLITTFLLANVGEVREAMEMLGG